MLLDMEPAFGSQIVAYRKSEAAARTLPPAGCALLGSSAPCARRESRGADGFVTVRARYLRADSAAHTESAVTLKVLVVRRSGSWWLATPQAFNPGAASHAGLTEAQLRSEYRKLLLAAGGR